MPYLPRIVDEELNRRLKATGGVVIEGPKACGKTRTARQIAESEVLLDMDEGARAALEIDPSLVLKGDPPRLIDEWQVDPRIWNHVRREIDDRGEPGQFILTGSAIPADDVTRHTGAGRLTRLKMRPMSLLESGISNGTVSLKDTMNGRSVRAADEGLTVGDLTESIVRGGWPALHDLSTADAQQGVMDYLEEIRRFDTSVIDGVQRNPDKIALLLQSLARNTGTYAAATSLSQDTAGPDGGSLKDDTVRAYLSVLDRLMVIEDQPAWSPNLRSKAVMRKAAKRHFVDPSLAAAALRASPERLLMDLNLLGFMFESLVTRDLRIYGQSIGSKVFQYRDDKGVEIDAILDSGDGQWGAFEIKLGSGRVDQAAESLKKFADRVDTSKSGAPAVLGVIVGTGYGYTRKDGIAVIPIGCLGP